MTRGIKRTKETVNESIKHTGFQLVGEYTKARDKTTFRCSQGHEWQARPCDVLSGKGCPHCDTLNRTLTKEIVNDRLKPYDIHLEGEYMGAHIKTTFGCLEGHTWSSTPDTALRGHKCIHCHTKGSGFKHQLPGWCYVLEFDTFIKYGITNNPAQRLAKHNKAGTYVVRLLERQHNGLDAIRWEQSIKLQHGGHYVDKTVMPDGFTETLSKDLLDTLLAY